ncbi:HAD-like domain-containing protein [Stachybotrys elegans]|uniref:HAD-like domain-containing protein n=1 Tax=Stachybotrys elegans TaxID=80388 RepID=A0A8K0T7M3_9HYPO|nr:HAD-like domain-containing protein [Stachybotrys elegans]
MSRPNLLLCFDAFGTLFRPKRSVAQQYGEVARQCGLVGFSDDKLQACLKAAFKDEAKRNPNYGKATGLGATMWWTNVIHKTFTPLLAKDQPLPEDLAPRLLHRFSSRDGYDAEPNLVSALKALKRQTAHQRFDKIIVGVITNSDDRVPDVLSSFGVNSFDIDFHCMSYDVGVEKPEKLIFSAAEGMLSKIIAVREGKTPAEGGSDVGAWQKVYVGDEYAKDVVGAANAGWNPVLLDSEGNTADVPMLKECDDTLTGLFKKHRVVKVHSIQDLVSWLMRE